MRIGLFGGTFDPPHTGHLIVAQDAALALGLDRILFIPAGQPPHKEPRSVTPAELRVGMLELALGGDDRFAIDRLEVEREGASYTVDTLGELQRRWPGAELTLLIGADQYAEFDSWQRPDEIRQRVRLGVLTRAGSGAAGPAIGPDAAVVEVTRIDISSTALRKRVASGLPIRYMVPAAVERFIFERQLYSRNGPVVTG
ncbi:nicotinate-nucleotide adenylyltransferase [soil metagenome]